MRPDHDADKGDLSTLLPPIPPARVLPRHDEHRAGLLAALSPEQPAARPTRPEWSSARRILVPVAAAAAVTGIIFAALALPHIGGTPATTAGKHPKPGQATPQSGPLTATRRWQVAAAGVKRVVVSNASRQAPSHCWGTPWRWASTSALTSASHGRSRSRWL